MSCPPVANNLAVCASDSANLRAARELAGAVTDPEIPVLTLADLGILRDVRLEDGRLTVILTPTYTGCPATAVIESDVRAALLAGGWPDARVRTTLTPPWTTDWITPLGRQKLLDYGIAPPGPAKPGVATIRLVPRRNGSASSGGVPVNPSGGVPVSPDGQHTGDSQIEDIDELALPACPRCTSARVERLAEHGSTACKALYRCLACREPFDYFKPY